MRLAPSRRAGANKRCHSFPGCHSFPESPGAVKQAAQRTLLVLIADPDACVRNLAAEAVERLGYRALLARNGEEAFHLASGRGSSIPLLVTSVTLPGMSGLELATRLREQAPAIKVIYMSARNDDVRVNAPIHPGSMSLPKPFTCEELCFEVGALLGAA